MTSHCSKLIKSAATIRARSMLYQELSTAELDSFIIYTSSIKMRVSCFSKVTFTLCNTHRVSDIHADRQDKHNTHTHTHTHTHTTHMYTATNRIKETCVDRQTDIHTHVCRQTHTERDTHTQTHDQKVDRHGHTHTRAHDRHIQYIWLLTVACFV